MNIQETIRKSIDIALKNLGISGVSFVIEHPTELSHGDYATNVALAASKIMGKSPREVAELIEQELQDADIPEVAKITIAGPGFINFTLSPEFFATAMHEILESNDQFGNSQMYAGKKILIEHSSPNLFKPFHIGHMMNNAIGESLTRLMKASGAEVSTMSFPSDISLGVAKALFVLLEKYGADFVPDNIAVLGEAYTEGVRRYDEDIAIQDRVREITDNLYAEKDSDEWKLYQACKQFNLDYFVLVTEKLGSNFDAFIYESEAGVVGKEIVQKHVPDVFTESEGAVVYIPDEEKKHINTTVFINSQGNPTYGAKDIGLLSMKFDRFAPDLSLFVTDHEQIPHFNVVLDAAEKINPLWANNSVHIAHGRMQFKGEKMSSRLGNVPLATDMIDVVSEEAQSRTQEGQNAEMIAIAAIKFAILRAKPGMNINFDPETSLSFEGDSGPYLQYTHARIQSLIEKATELQIVPKHGNNEISDVEKIVYRFPEIVEHAIAEYAPQYIVSYLLSVAQAFNTYYAGNKIIDSDNPEVSAHRLAIARAVQIVLKNGLRLLAINAPEKM